jgi:D-alanyl-D-alanine carboxypeptidase/D-alanyl-D-alanine-endopeptidase (penicillin-binding protein 4)
LNRFLGEAGVPKGDVLFEEGSGLSRNNLTTARATVALLEFMSRHKAAEEFRLGLPIAGVDGTLRNRMKGTAAAGNVRAKTGTLRWAISLSGYLTSAAGEKLVFSVMLNRYHNPNGARSGRDEVDTIPVMLAEFSGKSGEAQKH